MFVVYEVLLHLMALVAIPKMLFQMAFRGKYRKSFGQRFGIGFPEIVKGARRLIWVHAVSLGETKAVAPLVRKLKEMPDNPLVVVSSITETGHGEAVKGMPEADFHVYLPFDLRYVIRPLIRRIRPDLVMITETDFWANFLWESKAVGALVVLVNGKISERSTLRHQKCRWGSDLLLAPFDRLCVQSPIYQTRFESIGVPKEKIVVTGNLKLDDKYPEMTPAEVTAWKRTLGIKPNGPVLVIGSTHDPEESNLLDALSAVWASFPTLKVLLVPRHPERFLAVASLIESKKIPYARMSAITPKDADAKVILVDQMGTLRKCYQLATVALVAGSFTTKVGAHNLIEPSWYGVPVLYGPSIYAQPDLHELVQTFNAGIQVTLETFPQTLLTLLNSPEKRALLGSGGKAIFQSSSGAITRTLNLL